MIFPTTNVVTTRSFSFSNYGNLVLGNPAARHGVILSHRREEIGFLRWLLFRLGQQDRERRAQGRARRASPAPAQGSTCRGQLRPVPDGMGEGTTTGLQEAPLSPEGALASVQGRDPS